MQSRTHWHDLLGRHCPRFGQDTTVDAQINASMQREICHNHQVQVIAQALREASLLTAVCGQCRWRFQSHSQRDMPVRTDTRYNSHLTVRTTPRSSCHSNSNHPTRSVCCQHAYRTLQRPEIIPMQHLS